MRHWLSCFMVVGTAICLSNCSGSTDKYEVLLLHGNVTYQGQPLQEGVINFMPSDLSNSFSGNINNGTYDVKINQEAFSESPRQMLVIISAWETAPSMGADGQPVPGKEKIPPKYFDPKTSGLTAEVSIKNRTFDFNLQ